MLATVLVAAALSAAACSGCAGDREPLPADLVAEYLEVGFGNRFGEPPGMLRKWQPGRVVVVRPSGEPSYEDRLHLRRLVRDLDAAMGHLDLDLVEWVGWEERPPDVEIRFLPLAEISVTAAGGDAAYPARFDCRADAGGRFEYALLLLPSDAGVPQYMRFNLLAEGLAACLGLAGGTYGDAASAFYAPPNWYEEGFTRRDLALFALHDRPELVPGLSRDEAAERLRR